MSALIPSSTTLIPTTTGQLGGIEQTLVDARTLHERLGTSTRFADWIQAAIQTHGFVAGEDFQTRTEKPPGLFGGRPKIEYSLSIDMAKELALLSATPAGRVIRRALIAYERDTPALLHRQQARIAQLRRALIASSPETEALIRYTGLGLTGVEIGRLLGISADAARKRIRKAVDQGLIDHRPTSRKALAGPKSAALSQGALDMLGV